MKKVVFIGLYLLTVALAWAQDTIYRCRFDGIADQSGWVFAGSLQPNYWTIGTPTGEYPAGVEHGGCLFVTSGGSSNTYNQALYSVAYAYRRVVLPAGVVRVDYDWRCKGYAVGDSATDFMRVLLIPDDLTPIAGSVLSGMGSLPIGGVPTGCVSLDEGHPLRGSTTWQSHSQQLYLTEGDTFRLVFMWFNSYYGAGDCQPPAAVDNVLMVQPVCAQPMGLYVDPLLPTSFTLHWTDYGQSPTTWVVELDSASQSYGQGVRQSVTDTVAAVGGLAPDEDYRVWVAAVCGGDTLDPVSLAVHTPCLPLATLPYEQGFATVARGGLPPCWHALPEANSVSVGGDYYYGTSELVWRVSGDRYKCVSLRGLDVDRVPLQTVQLRFKAKSNSEDYGQSFEVGVMSSQSSIGSFVPVGSVWVRGSEWEEYVVEFSEYDGMGSYIALRELGSALVAGCEVVFDDFVIERMVGCQQVRQLVTSHTDAVGTVVEWSLLPGTVHVPADYEVRVEPADTGTAPTAPTDSCLTFSTAEPRCIVSGLAPATAYRAWVRAHCANDSLSGWAGVCFTTMPLPCATGDTTTADTVVVGTDSHHATGVPVSYYYPYSLCQSYYSAAELRDSGLMAGTITGMDYTFTNNRHDMMAAIYVSLSTDSVYATVADMEPVRRWDCVYGPALHPAGTSGTVHFEFDHPLVWDGVGNLVVTMVVNDTSGVLQSPMFYGSSTHTPATSTVTGYMVEEPFTLDNVASGNMSLSQYRPSVAFHRMACAEVSECAPPSVVVREVGEDYAHVEWVPGHDEEAWTVCYRRICDGITASSDSGWMVADTLVTTNGYLLASLVPYSDYEVRVNPASGSTMDSLSGLMRTGCDSVYGYAVFATTCAAIRDLPLVEDFEDFYAPRTQDSGVETCWCRGTNHSGNNCFPSIDTNYAYGGSRSLQYSCAWDYSRHYLATPFVDEDANRLQVSFYAYGINNYVVRVGVMTDPDDILTFEEVAQVRPTHLGEWELKEVPLANYSGARGHIALVTVGMVGRVYVDDLTVDYIQPCPRPRNILVSNITRTSAELEWDGGIANGYEVEYGLAGFEPGTGTVVACGNDTLTLRGLHHSTRYDVYIYAFCGDDTSFRSFITTFTTACGEIENLPYRVDFEDAGVGPGARPICWTCGCHRYPYTYPYIINRVDGEGRSLGRGLGMPAKNGDEVYAVLPAIDTALGALTTLQLVVKASTDTVQTATGSHCLVVGVCMTEGDYTTFSPLDTIDLAYVPAVYEVPLDRASGMGRYVTLLSAPVGRRTASGSASRNIAYIDSLVIEPIPSCQRPRGLHADSATTTTATLTWTAGGRATEWQVEYMPHGAPIGTGTRIIVASTTITLTGLAPATAYDFYVRSICDTGDTSEWSYRPGYLLTQQIPATVPYSYGFDTLSEWDNWQTLSNGTENWYRGMADGLAAPAMYVSIDSGATRSTRGRDVVNAVAYRDIDFGNHDSTYVLTFSASVGGTHSDYGNNYDGLAVFLADPGVVPFEPTDIGEQSPWGQLEDLTLLAHIQDAMTWTDYSILFDGLTGVHRLVFYWYRYGRDTYVGQPPAVDNLSIGYEQCQHPYALCATDVTEVSATVSWHGSATADYYVMLYDPAMHLLADDTVHTNSINYIDLLPGSIYKVRVRRLCDSCVSALSPLFTFATNVCNGGVLDTLDNSSWRGSSPEIPVNNSYYYTYTQQIIQSYELSGAGEITSINFLYDSPLRMTAKTNCTIYMGLTSHGSFSTFDDFVPTEELHTVYIGSLNCSQGWNRIILGTPFAYDGTSNLVIAIDDNSDQHNNYNYQFAIIGTTNPMTLSYSGYDNVDCSSSAALAAYEGSKSLHSSRPVLTVEMCPPNPCQPPRLFQPRVRANDVTIRWRDTGRRYLFGYRLTGSDSWIEDDIPVTDTFYTLTRYLFGADYVFHVRQYCDSTSLSNWAIGSFNTAEIPCLPPLDLRATDVTNHSARLSWMPEDNNIGYRLHLWGGGLDTIVTTYLATGTTVDSLNAATRYHAAVEVQCEYIDEPSQWSDTITFVTSVCPDATDLTALEVHGNSVLLDWQCAEGVDAWLVEWGLQGFDQGTGITVTADHHPYLLTGLTGETTYDIVVRSVCGDDYVSESWSNRLTLTTAYSGIETDTFTQSHINAITITPNPTSGDMQLTLPAEVGALRVEVIDMAGRTLQTYTLPAHTNTFTQSHNHTFTITLATSQLPQGAYYVRVTGDRLSVVKKALKID